MARRARAPLRSAAPAARPLRTRVDRAFSYGSRPLPPGATGSARVSSRRRFDWGNDHRRPRPVADTVLYEIHVKGRPRASRTFPKPCAAPTPGSPRRRCSNHFQRLGVTAVNLLPFIVFSTRAPHQERATNYWGYNTLAFFAPEPRYAARINGQSVIAEFARWCARCTRRHRGHSRRRLQPHGRNRRVRPDPFLPRHRQRQLLPPAARQSLTATRTTAAAATPSIWPTRACCNWSWIRCATGSGNARRRLPLRSRRNPDA
jgi:hypothetical protein